jgi:long-subunit fatty acid transport protein
MIDFRFRGCLPMVLLLSVSTSAAADDTNYQTYVIGARASGMGGAYAALAGSAGGEYYNPAALSLVDRSSVSLSHSFYSYQRRRISEGVRLPLDEPSERTDLTDSRIPTIPAAVSFAARVAQNKAFFKRISLGYSLFVPYQSEFSVDGVATASGASGRKYEVRLDVSDKDRTLMHGPTVAARFAGGWGVGFSLFHLYRTAETWTAGHMVTPPADDRDLTDLFARTEARLRRTVHSLVFKLGARYDINKNFILGLAVTSPSISLFGSGDVRSGTVSTNTKGECAFEPCLRFREAYLEPDVDSKTPFSVRLGGAFVSDRRNLTLSLDITLHGPLTYNPYGVTDPAEVVPEKNIQDLPAGYAVVGQIERRALANVNLGAEFRIKSWDLRTGFFTNFSSAPVVERSSFAQLPSVDMFGVTLAVGYRWAKSYFSLGVLYSFGSGTISTIAPPPPGQPELAFAPTPERRDYIYLYLEGAARALGDAAIEVKDRIMGNGEKGPAEAAPRSK